MKSLTLILCLSLLSLPAFAEDKETGYDRVIRTNTIRCGYGLWPPILIKDEKTDAFSGVAYDVMEEISKRLSIKVEWTEEAGLDTILQGMSTGRYDMTCFPLYALGTRARTSFFSSPLFYTPVYVVVREGDKRFDNNLMLLNDKDIKVATLEGEATAILTQQRLPKAQIHAVPQIQGYGFVLKDVAIGKADATFSDQTSVNDFNKTNKEKLRLIKTKPFAVNAVAFPLPQDPKFKELINTAILDIINDGWFENLLETKYPDYKNQNLMLSKPYESQR